MVQPEMAISTKQFALPNGERYVMLISWERPRPTAFFGDSPVKYLRYAGLLMTAFLLCWALARYLSSPIGKLRRATQKLADGDLTRAWPTRSETGVMSLPSWPGILMLWPSGSNR